MSEVRIVPEDSGDVPAGVHHKLHVPSDIGEPKAQKPRLSRTEKVAGAANTQVFFSDMESVITLIEYPQSFLCVIGEWFLVHKDAV